MIWAGPNEEALGKAENTLPALESLWGHMLFSQRLAISRKYRTENLK